MNNSEIDPDILQVFSVSELFAEFVKICTEKDKLTAASKEASADAQTPFCSHCCRAVT
jgi:hypothetical protein